jgi:hypothetical protein
MIMLFTFQASGKYDHETRYDDATVVISRLQPFFPKRIYFFNLACLDMTTLGLPLLASEPRLSAKR